VRGGAKRSGNKAELHIGDLLAWPVASLILSFGKIDAPLPATADPQRGDPLSAE